MNRNLIEKVEKGNLGTGYKVCKNPEEGKKMTMNSLPPGHLE
jgi:hypothetical protein